jgi:gp16 family phage-associated protein
VTKRRSIDRATTKTIQAVKAEFIRDGVTVVEWAAEHGVSEASVRKVLAGKSRCIRGASHRIAVLLGLKDGVIRDSVANG